MGNPVVKVRIATEAEDADVRKYEASLRKLDSAASDFVNTLKLGVGIDIGGRIVGALSQGPAILQQWVERGVSFNTSMADAEVAIANVVQKFAGLNSEAAKNEAAKAMAKIIEVEPQAAGSMQDLVAGLLATVGSAQAAGISIEKNVDLVGRFANALANANIPAEQLSQEMRAIFTGNITPDASLAKILQITNQDVEAAKNAGNLFDVLVDKIGALGAAGDTFGVKFSSLESSMDKALGALAQGVTQELGAAAETLANGLGDPQTVATLQQLGVSIAEIVKDGAELVAWAVKNADSLASLARYAGMATVAFTALKIKDLVAGFGLKAVAIGKNVTALASETTALAANTAAQNANSAARGGGGGGGGFGTKLAGAANTAIGVGVVGGAVASEFFTQAGERRVSEANAGASASLQRTGAVFDQVMDAGTAEESTAAYEALVKAITSAQHAMQTASGAELQNLAQEIRYLEGIDARFSEIVGSRVRESKAAAEKKTKSSEELELMRQQLEVQRLRAFGMDKEAQALEEELTIRKQVAALMKADPQLDKDLVTKEVTSQVVGARNAKKTADLFESETAFRDATERPEDRLARLQEDFQKQTGKAAPANATASDLQGLTEGNAKGLDIARQILDTQRQINEATAQAGEESRRGLEESIERANRLEQAKIAVSEEIEIQRALAAGEKEKAAELERERSTREKIKQLQAEGLSLEQATTAAKQLQTEALQQENREKSQKQGDVMAELELEKAKAGGSKSAVRKAENSLFQRQQQKRFEDAGFSSDEARGLAGQALDAKQDAERRASGRIGGTARRSSRDTLGGGIDNLAALRTPMADKIATTPEAKAGKPEAAGGGGQKPDLGGDAVKGAAAETKAAGAALKAAATELKTVMSDIRAQFEELRSELQGAINRETGR